MVLGHDLKALTKRRSALALAAFILLACIGIWVAGVRRSALRTSLIDDTDMVRTRKRRTKLN
jgi:hypothetical protein